MERTRARQVPRGASTTIWSPTFLPSTARPTGDSGETPPTLEICEGHLLAVLPRELDP